MDAENLKLAKSVCTFVSNTLKCSIYLLDDLLFCDGHRWRRKNLGVRWGAVPSTLLIWHRLQGITRGLVPLYQLSSCACCFCSVRKAIARSISSISFCKSVFLSDNSKMDLSMSWCDIVLLLSVLFIYLRTNPNHAILPPIGYKCPAQLQQLIIPLLLWLCESESLNPPGCLEFW